MLLQFCECPSPSVSLNDRVARTYHIISQTVGFTVCIYLFLLLAPYSPTHLPRQRGFTAYPTHTLTRHRSLLMPVPNLKYVSVSPRITMSQLSISGSRSAPVNLVSNQSYPVLTSHRVNSWLSWKRQVLEDVVSMWGRVVQSSLECSDIACSGVGSEGNKDQSCH